VRKARLGVVVQYLGMLLMLLGGFMVVPLLVSVLYWEHDSLAFLVSAVVTALVGAFLRFQSRGQPGDLQRRESLAVVGIGWLLVSLFSALPYILAGTLSNPIDAYFESISGFTTTGASVLTDIEAQPHGILFWRDFTQWLGGMGIIALFIALLPLTRIGAAGAAALFEDEAPAPQVDRVTPRIRDTAKALWIIYLGISAVEVSLLLLLGMPLFEAITNTFGTMATGGFSPRNASIAAYGPAIQWVITLFMVVAGANFALYYVAFRGRVARMLADTELRAYVGILGAGTLLVTLDLMLNLGTLAPLEALRLGAFQIVSLQTTTGFATADYDLWPWFSKVVILTVMFIGGSSGSTASSLKVIRFVIIVKYAYRQLYLMIRPRAVVSLRMSGKVIPDHIIRESMGFFIVYQAVIVLSVVALAAMGVEFVTAVSSTLATAGNVGPGLGLVGPVANYAGMPEPAKLLYCFNMWIGRLEFWTVLVLLRPAFWRET
jgi:trk system potassium uptake protein